MRDDEFEWDDSKAERNLREHGISFEVARLAFDDPFAVDVEDETEHYHEVRYNRLGMVEDRLLHVTYTFRQDRVRIISARLAETYERRRYHEQSS